MEGIPSLVCLSHMLPGSHCLVRFPNFPVFAAVWVYVLGEALNVARGLHAPQSVAAVFAHHLRWIMTASATHCYCLPRRPGFLACLTCLTSLVRGGGCAFEAAWNTAAGASAAGHVTQHGLFDVRWLWLSRRARAGYHTNTWAISPLSHAHGAKDSVVQRHIILLLTAADEGLGLTTHLPLRGVLRGPGSPPLATRGCHQRRALRQRHRCGWLLHGHGLDFLLHRRLSNCRFH
mmetsp:Transcript_100627/g.203959  ORF Transcript_100627/g.203959 Transcript_100627/m.203959 type:complete len:233 (-) Transcript_100627:94-792(-)